jgi:hypothetical protein
MEGEISTGPKWLLELVGSSFDGNNNHHIVQEFTARAKAGIVSYLNHSFIDQSRD